jgi:hypothetical protein
MADRRNKQLDGPINPAIMGGLIFISDTITADNGAVITITFPAKTIFTVIVQTTGTGVASTKSVSNGTGTVTFTLTGDGAVSFIITGSTVETVADLDILTEATYSITPKI